MTKLYLDCDGVILDTIDMSYKMIKSSWNFIDVDNCYIQI